MRQRYRRRTERAACITGLGSRTEVYLDPYADPPHTLHRIHGNAVRENRPDPDVSALNLNRKQAIPRNGPGSAPGVLVEGERDASAVGRVDGDR